MSDFEHLERSGDPLLEAIANNKDKRVYVTSRSLEMYIRVYLPHWMHHEFAPFHYQMFGDTERLMRQQGEHGYLKYVVWRMFRESIKSTAARALNLQMICAKDILNVRENIYWVGYEDKAVEKHVRTVANELQGNERIIRDFGHLYFEEKKKDDVRKKKTVMDFTSSNGVHVAAIGTGGSARGILDGPRRPDFVFVDDVENEVTKKSRVRTQTIINFLDEMMSGTAASVGYLMCGNWISEIGVMNFLCEKAKALGDRGLVRTVRLYEDDELAWKQRWVWTIEQAERINATRKPVNWVDSVEGKRMEIKGNGSFEQEYLLIPKGSGGKFTEASFRGFVMSDAEELKEQMTIAIVVDPAFSTSKDSDTCPIGALGKVPRVLDIGNGKKLTINDYYLLDGKADQFLPSRSHEDAINMAFKWMSLGYRVRFVSVEDVSINNKQRAFVENLKKAMKQRGLSLPLRRSRPVGQGAKEVRILSELEPVTESGRLFIRADDEDNPFWHKFREQFLGFPLYPHDDIPDMVAQGVHEHEVGGSNQKAIQSEVSPEWQAVMGQERPEKLPVGEETAGIELPAEKILQEVRERRNGVQDVVQSSVDDYWNPSNF